MTSPTVHSRRVSKSTRTSRCVVSRHCCCDCARHHTAHPKAIQHIAVLCGRSPSGRICGMCHRLRGMGRVILVRMRTSRSFKEVYQDVRFSIDSHLLSPLQDLTTSTYTSLTSTQKHPRVSQVHPLEAILDHSHHLSTTPWREPRAAESSPRLSQHSVLERPIAVA